MCVYADCLFNCQTKNEHHSRYAIMRRDRRVEITKNPTDQKSKKVNWELVEQLKIDIFPINSRSRLKRKSYIDICKE